MKFLLSRTNSVTAKVWQMYAIAVLTLLGTLGTVYLELQNVTQANADRIHVRNITNELTLLGENLLDAETGQRGYLLTLKAEYLQPYLQAKQAIDIRIVNLTRLLTDDKAMTDFDLMQPVISAKLNELSHTIALAQQGKLGEALSLVNTDAGKNYMDEFRRLRTEMIERETFILNKHRDTAEKELHAAIASIGVGGLLAIIIMLFSALSATKRLGKPILSLLKGFESVAEGKPSFEVNVTGKDEIARISASFNQMANEIVESRRIREEMMAELKRSNSDLDKFAYVASHDLKAPLRGIKSLAQWIEEDVADTASAETLENIGLLKSRVDRLEKLLESLLAYSRIGSKTEAPEVVNIPKLIEEITDYLAPSAQFEVGYKGDAHDLTILKVPIELVLRNLINNALKHHDMTSGKVDIYAKDLGDQIEFTVADDGSGIAPEFHERIFEMFQTLKPRDHTEGSGMGLAMVKKTVEVYGGRIRVNSAPPIRGTSFVFSWKK